MYCTIWPIAVLLHCSRASCGAGSRSDGCRRLSAEYKGAGGKKVISKHFYQQLLLRSPWARDLTLKTLSGAVECKGKLVTFCMRYTERSSVSFSNRWFVEQPWSEIEAYCYSAYSLYLGYNPETFGKQINRNIFFNILKPLPGFLVINTKEKLPALWCLWCFLYTISFRSHLIPPSVWLRARRKTHKCYSFGYLFYRWSLLDTCGNCQKRDWSGCLMDYFPAELIALGVRHSTVAPSHLSGSWNEPFF